MDFNFDTGSISSILSLDPGSSALEVAGTSGITLPIGNDAQRIPTTGNLRFNSTSLQFEGYNGTAWTPFIGSSANLTSLSNLSTTGVVTQTSPGVFSTITYLGVAGHTVVTNGNGTSGNITIDLATAGTAGSGYVSVTTDIYGRVTSGATTQSWSTISSTPTTLAGYGITDALITGGAGVTSIAAGLFASRPSAGTAGKIYYSTDTNATYYDNGTTWDIATPAYTGDVTKSAGSLSTTLATVNTNVGTFGDSSHVGQFTVNGKGLITAATSVSITPAAIGAVNVSQLGAVNGVATLDSSGTLSVGQIPASLLGSLIYQGVWNASTNTPTLADGTGVTGNYYKVSVAGTTSLGGQSRWSVGDLVVYNGATWDGIDSVGSEVVSVNGKTGALTLSLASADFANQGTTTTFLRGNAAGNPSFSAINLSTDVSGTLQAGQVPAFTGDVTTTAGSLSTTLATVNSTVGTFGTATKVGSFTVNAKGLITNASEISIPNTVTIGGDATGSGTTSTTTTITLATVNSNVGSFGSSSVVPVITTNAKGLITAVSTATITASAIGAVSDGGGTPSITSGLFSARPTAGTAGVIFISTDTHTIFRDNGVSWDPIGGGTLSLYNENASAPVASTVTGANSVSIGSGNTASAVNSTAIGSGAKASLYGGQVQASGSFAAIGDAQAGKYVLRNTTTGAETAKEIFLDGSAARLVLPNNSAFMYSATFVARSATAGFEGAWKIEGLVSRDANAASTTLVGSRSKTVLTRPNTTWNVEVSADTTNGALVFKVDGQATHNIRWVCTVTTTEVSS